MVDVINIILRTSFSFAMLFFLTRLLGKKQMSQMTYFNYITSITTGTLTANIIAIDSETLLDEIVGLIWWVILAIIIGFITLKSAKIRSFIDGQPTILIKNGKLSRKALKDTRLDLYELSMMLRTKDIFSVSDVDYAILEPNGEVTVLKKHAQLNITKSDMNIPQTTPTYMPSVLISDGAIVDKNLKELGLSRDWLKKELENNNINDSKEVFYAEILGNGKVYIEKNQG